MAGTTSGSFAPVVCSLPAPSLAPAGCLWASVSAAHMPYGLVMEAGLELDADIFSVANACEVDLLVVGDPVGAEVKDC